MIQIKPPIVQIALDFATIDEALAMANIGVEAGVDWLEIGTPLIVSRGPVADRQDGPRVSQLPGAGRLQDDGLRRQERASHQGARRPHHDRLRQRAG